MNEEYWKGFFFMALIHLHQYEVSDLKGMEYDQLKKIFEWNVKNDEEFLSDYLMNDDGDSIEWSDATEWDKAVAYDGYIENNIEVLADYGVSRDLQFCDCHEAV